MDQKHISAFILRTTPTRSRAWILSCFSDLFGRVSLLAFPKNGQVFAPFSLIEATVSSSNDLMKASDLVIHDTFLKIREQKECLQSASLLFALLEKWLPMNEPSIELWDMVNSLFPLLHTFHDWKAPPLMVALFFFQHEGHSLTSLTDNPLLPKECQETAKTLFQGDEKTWREAIIPLPLFQAAFETLGLNYLTRCTNYFRS